MNPDELLERMLESGAVQPADDSDEYRLTESFRESFRREESALDDLSETEFQEHVEELILRDDLDAAATAVMEVDRSPFIVTMTTLKQMDDTLSLQKLRPVTLAVEQLRRGMPPDEGSPDYFHPIFGDQVSPLVTFHERVIVYNWQHDCPPCDEMRDRLNEVFDARPDDIALFSVFGPNWAELLFDKFNVRGAPTILFFRNGTVDLRIEGLQYTRVLESELETFRS